MKLDADKKVVLMPFCIEAVLMYHKLTRENIKVFGFFDSNLRLAAQSRSYLGRPIMEPFYAQDCCVIICHAKHMDEITNQLLEHAYHAEDLLDWRLVETSYNNLDVCDEIDLATYQSCSPYEAIYNNDADGRNGTIIVKELRALRRVAPNCKDNGGVYHTIPFHYAKYETIDGSELPRYRDNTESPLFTVDNCDLKITDVCTLRCKFCSVLLDYPVERKEYPLQDVKSTFFGFLDKVDFARRMTLLGGEPFTCSHLKELLQAIVDSDVVKKKIGILYLYTNATIVPDDDIFQLLHDAEIFVVISEYTSVKSKILDFVSKLNRFKVHYMIGMMNVNWFDMNSIVDYADAEKKSARCNATNCPEIADGKFYKCAFLLQAPKLEAIPYDERDYIAIGDMTKEKLLAYKKSYTPGCGWCKGRNFEQWKNERVPAALQLKEPRSYKKYTE